MVVVRTVVILGGGELEAGAGGLLEVVGATLLVDDTGVFSTSALDEEVTDAVLLEVVTGFGVTTTAGSFVSGNGAALMGPEFRIVSSTGAEETLERGR